MKTAGSKDDAGEIDAADTPCSRCGGADEMRPPLHEL